MWGLIHAMTEKRKIFYYSSESAKGHNLVFRDGEAWQVDPDPRSPMEDEDSVTKLRLDVEVVTALFRFGIVDELQHLPMQFGPIDLFEEAILLPSGLAEGARILREVCDSLPPGSQDVFCGSQVTPAEMEYRIAIDMREVKKGMMGLADFFEEAARKQLGVQLWF